MDKNPPFNEAIEVADPYREIYPENTPSHCFARSIWAMHEYNGRIYIGCGDARFKNQGPIPIMSFFDKKGSIDLREECVIREEMVDRFREHNDILIVPGFDAMDSYEYGNFYFKKNERWEKKRTIPNGVHVTDIAVYRNELFAAFTMPNYKATIMRSGDFGDTWLPLVENAGGIVFGELVPMDDYMAIIGPYQRYVYNNGEIQGFINSEETFGQALRFKDNIIFAPVLQWFPYGFNGGVPLYVIKDIEEGFVKVPHFDQDNIWVRYIRVQDGVCYVLALIQKHPYKYKAFVDYSEDLVNWNRLARFEAPAPPYSFEILAGELFVGLGNRNPWDNLADVKSGTIWKVRV